MAYYIASDFEIPIIPWDEASPGLFVMELQPDDDTNVIEHFSKPHIRYVGSHEGCGCGFRRGEDSFDEDKDEDALRDTAARQKDHEQLRDYLIRNCDGQKIEIYGCWEGEWWEECLDKIHIRVDEIADHRFCFQEKHLYIVDIKH